MSKQRFTDRWLQSPTLTPDKGRAEFVDGLCPGLHLRVTIQGTRTFSAMFRVNGKLTRETIGRYPRVRSDLSLGDLSVDLTKAERLAENLRRSFIGRQKDGPVDIPGDVARQIIVTGHNPHGRSNAEIVRPWRNGMDLTRRPTDRWLIDFMAMEGTEAALFEQPFEYARTFLKPIRDQNRDAKRRSHWWRPGRTGEDIRSALAGLPRFICTPRVSKFRLFVWLHASVNPDSATVAIARDDDLRR